jgi:hypothetical protein
LFFFVRVYASFRKGDPCCLPKPLALASITPLLAVSLFVLLR